MILRKNVIFECKDIEDSIDDIQGGNNFILARNFWKYLSRENLINASWKIGEKTNENTLVVIGNFDAQKFKETPFFLLFDILFTLFKSDNEKEPIVKYSVESIKS